MSIPRDFIPVRLRHVDARYGRSVIRQIKASEKARGVVTKRSRYTWAGPAAENALCHAFNSCRDHPHQAILPPTLRWDLTLETPRQALRCEVKTRVAERGWVHPERFDWVTVPLHQDREPVKPEAQRIICCWWSADTPRTLWVLGHLRGLDHFQKVSTFYKHGAWLPRGGKVHGTGTYVLDVSDLVPFPKGLLKEMKT